MSSLGVTGEVCESILSKQFEWKIADFFSLSTEKGSRYRSPSFVFDNTSLHLEICPGGDTNAKSGFLSVFLGNESYTPFRENRKWHIKKADGTLIGGESGDRTINPLQRMGFWNFFDRSDLEKNKSELIPSGSLTIICNLKRNHDGKQATVKADKVENVHAEQTMQTPGSDHGRLTELDVLSENLRDLSANKDSCDVVLEVEDKEFRAHKAILTARSSVFAAMFRHDTLEKQTGIIKIPDCDSESFQEFLNYLYCGKLEDVSFRSALHLYSTSNKYDVQKLKEFCIKYLIENLAPDNVCDIFKLADKYDETKLETETQLFFNENLSRIFPTAEWQNLMKNNFCLANKLLVDYSKAKGSQ